MNTFLAQLDRRLKERGEPVWLQRSSGGGVNTFRTRAEVPALVRTLTSEQLIGGITQQNIFIVISPTHLFDHRQWPGGLTPTPQSFGIIDPSDIRLPTTSDAIFARGKQRAIQNVQPVFDRAACIRIEITCLG